MSELDFKQRVALAEFLAAQFSGLRKGPLNTEIKCELVTGERVAAVLGGQVVGWVSIPKPATRAVVTDAKAFTAWVKANRPEEVETVDVVRPGTQRAILDSAKARDGKWLNPETGELVPIPGIEVKTGDAAPRVELTDEAAEGIGAAWRAGDIDLTPMLALPVAGGES